ncbi:MAG: NAD-dependent epimerase/dehydratase family protein [Opitutaceae bacterium]|nr:NAD-dependent epimerase/dehydratase family protein [Opitutaceae bacterium]
MARILVTGPAGFIGSHTVDLLLKEGHEVWGVDNLRTGRMSNLSAAGQSLRFHFVRADVAEEAPFNEILDEAQPEAIIHLAALVSVPESFEQPDENFRLNLTATHVVAEAAHRHGVKRMVFASSAAVYGRTEPFPLDEHCVTVPISPYGAAKLASESLLAGYAECFGLIIRSHRYFNVYGPRQDPSSPYSGVISRFWERLGEGSQPIIFGDGEQTRDFVYVGDVARANLLAATKPDVRSGVANICTGRPTSLNGLVQSMARLLGREVRPMHVAPRQGDIRHSLGSPKNAAVQLGFTASTTLAEGLQELFLRGDSGLRD